MLLSQPAFIARELLGEKDIPIKIMKGPISTFFVNIVSTSVLTLAPSRKHILDPRAMHVRAHMEEREIHDISPLKSLMQLLHQMQELKLCWVSHLLLQLGAWGKLLSSLFWCSKLQKKRRDQWTWAPSFHLRSQDPPAPCYDNSSIMSLPSNRKNDKNQNFKPSCSSGSLLLFVHIRSNEKNKPK